MTCDTTSKKCMTRECSACVDLIDEFAPQSLQYYQCSTCTSFCAAIVEKSTCKTMDLPSQEFSNSWINKTTHFSTVVISDNLNYTKIFCVHAMYFSRSPSKIPKLFSVMGRRLSFRKTMTSIFWPYLMEKVLEIAGGDGASKIMNRF